MAYQGNETRNETQDIIDWAISEGHYVRPWAPGMVLICAKDCGGGVVVNTLANAKAFILVQQAPHESYLSQQLRLYEERKVG